LGGTRKGVGEKILNSLNPGPLSVGGNIFGTKKSHSYLPSPMAGLARKRLQVKERKKEESEGGVSKGESCGISRGVPGRMKGNSSTILKNV